MKPMPKFMIAYHGGETSMSPEESAEHMAKWQTWLGDLGDAVVDAGTPLGESKFITSSGVSDGDGSSNLTGYSVVTAFNLDMALQMAKRCPFLDIGTLEVAEIKEM